MDLLAPDMSQIRRFSFNEYIINNGFCSEELADKVDLSLLPVIIPSQYHTKEVAVELILILRELETNLLIYRQKILDKLGIASLNEFDAKWGIGDDALGHNSSFIGMKVGHAYKKARYYLNLVENMNDSNIGCQIIGLFVLDMLGIESLRGLCYFSKHNKEFGTVRGW
jgi:hypothetical protein